MYPESLNNRKQFENSHPIRSCWTASGDSSNAWMKHYDSKTEISSYIHNKDPLKKFKSFSATSYTNSRRPKSENSTNLKGRKNRGYSSNYRSQGRRYSPSSHSEIIHPVSRQNHQAINPPIQDSNLNSLSSAGLSYEHHRRKLSSVSKRNSRHKALNIGNWSSEDTDTSIGTSEFGNYLSNLSACPSLDNCTNRSANRKLKKCLPKETKSSREKCYQFLYENFTNPSKLENEKKHCISIANSSSSDPSNSDLEVMEFVYSNDSLDELGQTSRERDTSQNHYNSAYNHENSISDFSGMKNPTILHQELEILKRKLLLKDVELRKSIKMNKEVSKDISQGPIKLHPWIQTMKNYSDLAPEDYDVYTNNEHDCVYKNNAVSGYPKESYRSSASTNSDNHYPYANNIGGFCSSSFHLSPEPQIMTPEHDQFTPNFHSLPRMHKRIFNQNEHSDSLFPMRSETTSLADNSCICSRESMSYPVQSLLKYFHPAKHSSPHSAFANSISSLESDNSYFGQKRISRLSLTSQFWSRKQINKDKKAAQNGFWNSSNSLERSNRISNDRSNVSKRECNPGVTPFGCTGFFIPATKMKSSRRRSDPFVNVCSRKTIDWMRSIQLPSNSRNKMTYRYLSGIMKLDNDLKIIPEKLTISSKP